MRTRMSQVLIPILGASLLLVGVIVVGRISRDYLRQDQHYVLHFSDIDCPAPPGLRREDFLPEVQFLGQLPNSLPALDDNTPSQLAAAFARHPWVEKVEQVRITPPNRAEVQLTFRTPALAVPQPDGTRVVDGHAILLPVTASSEGLPVLRGPIAHPSGLAGSAWDDPAVSAAAPVAAYLRSYRQRLGLISCEVRNGLVEIDCNSGRVAWGHAPGSEAADEEPAASKLRRLLDAHTVADPVIVGP